MTVIKIDRTDRGLFLVERTMNVGTDKEQIDSWCAQKLEVSWRARSDLWRIAEGPERASRGPPPEAVKEVDRAADRIDQKIEHVARVKMPSER